MAIFFSLSNTPYSDNDHWRMVAHACSHIRSQPTVTDSHVRMIQRSRFVLSNTLFLSLSPLNPIVQLGRDPPLTPLIYGKDPSFVHFLSPHSHTHTLCVFIHSNPKILSLGSQSERDRPQKKGLYLNTHTCCGCFISFFLSPIDNS